MEDLLPAVRKNKGQSLIEAIIAVAIIVLMISGLISAVIFSIKNAQFARNQSLATKYADEAVEELRSFRDQSLSWVAFTTGCSSYNPGAVPLPFTRTLTCSLVDANKMQISVTVSWVDAAGTHQSKLSSYFSNQTLWK